MREVEKQKETVVLNIDDKIKVVRFGENTDNLQLFQSFDDEGALKWKFRGYHQTIKQALDHVIRLEMLVEFKEYENLQKYVDEVNAANKKIYSYLEGN